MVKFLSASRTRMKTFSSDERGVALTEYAMLLGLFAGISILAVLSFSNSLGNIWELYAEFVAAFNPEDA